MIRNLDVDNDFLHSKHGKIEFNGKEYVALCFQSGLPLILLDLPVTIIIEQIDWENNLFKVDNSWIRFKFTPLSLMTLCK
jgi:hypothetical protein